METVEEFLAHAVQLEREAADLFSQLADAMESSGNMEVCKLFRRLAHFSRLHLDEAQQRSGFRDIPDIKPQDFQWPNDASPEAASIWADDPLIGVDEALQCALEAETEGLDYYSQVLSNTKDPEIAAFAREFVAEESEHVAELNRWIAYRASKSAAPSQS